MTTCITVTIVAVIVALFWWAVWATVTAIRNARETEEAWRRINYLQSWAGLMETLDWHYPPDLATGASGDPGPLVMALHREVKRLQDALLEARRASSIGSEVERVVDTALNEPGPAGREA